MRKYKSKTVENFDVCLSNVCKPMSKSTNIQKKKKVVYPIKASAEKKTSLRLSFSKKSRN